MASFYDDNEDLRFYVDRLVDWDPIVKLTEWDGHARDAFATTEDAVAFYRDVLRLVGEFVAEDVVPLVPQLDETPPTLVDGEVVHAQVHQDLFDRIKALELYGLCVPRELGGMNAPLLVYQLVNEMFARGDVSVTAHQGFHGGVAMAALAFSVLEGTSEFDREKGITKTRFREAIEEIVRGDAWGSMDITEAHAGSDMAQLKCRGEQDAEGNWFVTGEKIFITSGHGKWHFVIARTEDTKDDGDPFAGLGGLSMFLVPAYTTGPDGERVRHTTLTAIETKLGHHGSATVAIHFDRSPASLVGKRGEGFRYMLMMMNNARVGVGFESIGLCEAAYRKALDYARQRPSMGKTIDKHEMIAEYLDDMRTDIQALRALAVSAAIHEEMAQKLELRLRFWPPDSQDERKAVERQVRRHKRRARHLTPLLKYTASEKAVEMARRCVQIHGGSGYIVEYGAEKLLRDATVMPIYEGTSQIQALMAMKDNLMGAVRDPARFVREAAQVRWRAISARDPLERRVAKLQQIQHASIEFLLSRLAVSKVKELRGKRVRDWSTAMTGFDPKRDFALAMLHAERLCRILSDVAIAEELLAQVEKAPERAAILERWLEKAEPRCRFLHDEITTTGLRLLKELHGSDIADDRAAAK